MNERETKILFNPNSDNKELEKCPPDVKEESISTNSPTRDQNDDSEGSEKQSPSNQNFLSNLKGFNIEKAKYRHYGHKSSMDARKLEKIMNEPTNTTVKQSIVEEETGDSKESVLPKSKSIKYIIDEQIRSILGVTEEAISDDDIKPYEISTINEILKLKCEQERTKQDSIRCEFAVNVLELMKLAQTLNIEANLIPFLFLGDIPANTLKNKLQAQQENTASVINDLKEKSKTNIVIPQITSILNQPQPKNKEPQTTSNSSDSESKQTGYQSQARSPTSPNDSHRRVHSEGSIGKESSFNLEPTKIPLPIQNYSPQLQNPHVPQNIHIAPFYSQGTTNVPQNSSKDHHTTVMGSPYSQKYTNVTYQQPQAPYQGTNNYLPQQQFQFYMPSMSSNPPYMLPGHPPIPYTYNQYQNPESESKNSVGHFYRQDDTSPVKKARYSKPSEINFMISTPKNPPAKKYNTHNTSRDK